jgi:hypothetical protein
MMNLIKLIALLIALLVPAAAIAKGGCKEDKQKFCKDVVETNGAVRACLKQHAAELSEGCKAQSEAKEKKSGKKAKADKEQEVKPESNPAPTPESDTNKLDQPTPSDDTTKQ